MYLSMRSRISPQGPAVNSLQACFLQTRRPTATLLDEEVVRGSQPAAWELRDKQGGFPWMREEFSSPGLWQEMLPCRALFYFPHIHSFSDQQVSGLHSFWDNKVGGHLLKILGDTSSTGRGTALCCGCDGTSSSCQHLPLVICKQSYSGSSVP